MEDIPPPFPTLPHGGTAPPGGDPVPLGGDPVLPGDYPVPLGGDPVPLSGDSVPPGGDPVPLSGDPVPLSGDSVPLGGDSVPPGGELVPPVGMSLSMAGCGFLGIYHVGVSACLRQCAPHIPVGCVAGASAGAMAGACLLAGADLGVIRASIIQTAAAARSSSLGPFSPTFNIHDQLREGLSQVLPPDAHERVSGRLVVSLTRVSDGRNVLMTHFSSRLELIEALLCSSFIPFFSGLRPARVRGVRYIDGGISNNCPVTSPAAVTVSPFSGEADVCPADASASIMAFSITNSNFRLNRRNIQRFVHALFPPDPEDLKKVCQQGFDDMLDFLQKNGLVSCPRCSKILSLASSSNLKPKLTEGEEESSEIQEIREIGKGEVKKREGLTVSFSLDGADFSEKSTGEGDFKDDGEKNKGGFSISGLDDEPSLPLSPSAKVSKGGVKFAVSESDFCVDKSKNPVKREDSEGYSLDPTRNGLNPTEYGRNSTGYGPNPAGYGRNSTEYGSNPTNNASNPTQYRVPHTCTTTNHTKSTDNKSQTPKNTVAEESNTNVRHGISHYPPMDIVAHADIHSGDTPGWDTDTGHLCQDVRNFLDQRTSVLGVLLSESVCRMKCYNCAECRSILQEALMTEGVFTPLRDHRSLTSLTLASLRCLTLPLTSSLRLQYSLVRSLLRVLRLYHVTARTVAVLAAVLARHRRRRSVRDQETGPTGGSRGPTFMEAQYREEVGRKRQRVKRAHSVGSFDVTQRASQDTDGLQKAEAGLLKAEPGLHDLLESSLLSFYCEEGHMTECWALTTLTDMFPDV